MPIDKISITNLANKLLHYFGAMPDTYSTILISAIILLTFIAVIPVAYPKLANNKYYVSLFITIIIIAILFGRFPLLALELTNPDESLEIASAMTLTQDPVFWRSVDLGTHGPLTTYPLIAPLLFNIQIDYGSAKLIAVLMQLLSTILLFLTIRAFTSSKVAMLSVVPLVIFVSLTYFIDFISYNAEHPVNLLIAAALYFLAKFWQANGNRRLPLIFTAGLLLGCAPYAKIQSIPIAAAVFLFGCMAIYAKRSEENKVAPMLSTYIIGGTAATVIIICYVWFFGLYKDFMIRYIFGQFNYAGSNKFSGQSFAAFGSAFSKVNADNGKFFSLMAISSLLIVIIYLVYRKYKPHITTNPQPVDSGRRISNLTYYVLALLLLLIMSVIAVYLPGRAFHHYFLLISLPLALLSAIVVVVIYDKTTIKSVRILTILLYLSIPIAGQLYNRPYLLNFDGLFKQLLSIDSRFDQYITALIRQYSKPGEKMAIWGWADTYYVRSGLTIACKTGLTQISGDFGNKDYYLNSYLAELTTAKPPVFLDAVAPGQFAFTDKKIYGMERYDRVARYIQSNYTMVADVNGVRIYIRKERLGAA
ncbi:hypothetical protein OR1_00960 [Geobacter sp. OR-1]|uniref:ArnT family glycosyltransferase n=1 Tax=Geobacter sp. OR-1 TaxID=1266765 RepID=UPI0005423D04|nr:hypothetical protein [Geobacter sp. OR-1]GAM08687.1 hypothetical protein OR1_00960 [Geobacter sp. OR-1]